ncbi:hypothetical protein F2Q69_00002676 [Brassica cretica]|uniref:CTLH domain-containing protein n=1 Tax=Brassica cretica TaxID=69181 RepID=A0A8S9PCT3_BRACR|nr:hypothetical protein F2Q69_00002676 [Brassica cretica]
MRSCVDFSDALTGFEPVNYKDIRDGTLNTDYSVAIKAGDLNFAKEELSAFKPEILRNFHLLKQQFIELIREERHNDAFDFAQLHLKPFHEDMAFLKQVEEVMSLLVFENISTCPVKDFLGESQWLKTASEVNAAILSSFGKVCYVCELIGPKLQRLLKKLTLNQKQLDERAYEYPRMSDMSTGELIYPEE